MVGRTVQSTLKGGENRKQGRENKDFKKVVVVVGVGGWGVGGLETPYKLWFQSKSTVYSCLCVKEHLAPCKELLAVF